jgi:hypothetical protein
MHLTSANVCCFAGVDIPLGRLTWKMQSQRYSDGACDERGRDPLDLGCHPVVSLTAYLGFVQLRMNRTRLVVLDHNDQGG